LVGWVYALGLAMVVCLGIGGFAPAVFSFGAFVAIILIIVPIFEDIKIIKNRR
jgi:hypothetical protein